MEYAVIYVVDNRELDELHDFAHVLGVQIVGEFFGVEGFESATASANKHKAVILTDGLHSVSKVWYNTLFAMGLEVFYLESEAYLEIL